MKDKSKRKKYMPEKSMETETECVCPKCSKRHKTMMFYTGRGTPRVFCDACRKSYWYSNECALDNPLTIVNDSSHTKGKS
jgi:uncharacterized protein (DUF983 family)